MLHRLVSSLPQTVFAVAIATALVARGGDGSATGSGVDGTVGDAEREAARLERLAADLGSTDFQAREVAERQLIAAGPSAIDVVAKAARSDDLEASVRAVGVLQALLNADDRTVQERAEQALNALVEGQVSMAADVALEALTVYRLTRQDRAIEEIRRLGGQFSGQAGDEENQVVLRLELDSQWRGTSKDLGLLKQVPSIKRLGIHGMPLDETALKTLEQLPDLTELNLYGTGITADRAKHLAESLPQTKIELRNGALLGVEGSAQQAGCKIIRVRKDTAAAEAGLQTDDEIISFDGQPVNTFEELTALIGAKNGGDQVAIAFRRNGNVLTKQVTLGRWK